MTAPADPPLLAADEPAAATLVNEAGGAIFFLACDHAGRAIPRRLGTLGLPLARLSPVAWAATMRGATR